MENLEIGKVYRNGKLSREITNIVQNEIYYRTEKDQEKHCWITTFEDWVNRGKKNQETVTYKYEILYTEDGKEFITTYSLPDIETATIKANSKFNGKPDISNIKIVEFKTIQKIIPI